MRIQALLIAALLSAVLIAGCVGQMPGIPGFGVDVVKPERTTTATGVTDPILIENVRTLPEAMARPEQDIRLFMNIVCHETDPSKAIQSVWVDLFDGHVLKGRDTNAFCNVQKCMPSACGFDSKCVLHSNEVVPIEFLLKAPSQQEIANVATKATPSWLLRYDYSTSTNFDVLVVSEDEIIRLQQEGQTLSIPVQDTKGPGPVKIEFSAEPSFAIAGKQSGQQIFLTLKLRDAGSGFVKDRKIEDGKLKIEFPQGLSIDADPVKRGNDYFVCQLAETGKTVCTYDSKGDTRKLEFFKKETVPILFILNTQNEAQLGAPHRAYTINAFLDYTYELRGLATIEIKPTQFG